MGGETLSKDDVARRLGVTPRALDGMIRRKEFPVGVKPTARSRPVWPLAVFEAWLLIRPLLTGQVDGDGDGDGEDEDS